MTTIPTTTLAEQFSSPGATPTAWADGQQQLQDAQIFWIATVRPDGRPHIAPLMSVWLDDALYFCTGATERKAKNLAKKTHCILLTGSNAMDTGLDLVVEGDARNITDAALLQRIADAYVAKYGEGWRYTVHDGAFYHGDGSVREGHTARALVYALAPATAFGFGRGASFSQTRWHFA
jgi:general stress protein 26